MAFALAAQHLHCPLATVRGLPFWPWWPGRDGVGAMGSWQQKLKVEDVKWEVLFLVGMWD